MESLYVILVLALIIGAIFLIFYSIYTLFPLIVIIGGILYLYNRFIKPKKTQTFEEEIEYRQFDPYQNYTSHSNNMDIIDAEFTEREDED